MRIEKINDNQIKCILTKEDLASRHIKISELAYGSEKTRLLFRDMMEQAAADFGFEAGDIPLMIEAIPLSHEKIALIVTKVESPEELDTRFSQFTHQDDEDDGYIGSSDESSDESSFTDSMASEIMNMIEKMRGEEDHAAKTHAPKEHSASPSVCLYSFSDLELAINACKHIEHVYNGSSRLYKDSGKNVFYLLIKQGDCYSPQFTQINNMLCAYLTPEPFSAAAVLHFEEHLKTIIKTSAVQTLAKL